mgnify:FL=1
MSEQPIGRRVGDEKTLDARTIYNSAIQAGVSNSTAAKFVEAILEEEEKIIQKKEEE